MNLIEFAQKMNMTPEAAKELMYSRLRSCPMTDEMEFTMALEEMVVQEFFSAPTAPEKKDKPQKKSSKPKTNAEDGQVFRTNAEYIDLLDKTKRYLQSCVDRNFRIIVDTCSIIHKGDGCKQMAFPLFLEIIRSQIKGKRKLIVPYVVHEEIEWLSEHSEKPEIRKRADKMFDFLERAGLEDELVEIIGSRMDRPKRIERPFADPIILSKAGELRAHKCNVLVITQDKKLSLDLMDTNNVRSVESSAIIEVRCLDGTGCLIKRKRSELEKGVNES